MKKPIQSIKMNELIILIGIPGSGKTTYYLNNYEGTHLHINLDTLKTRGRETAIFKAAVDTNTDIVIDNTNITREKRKKYIDYVKNKNYTIVAIHFIEEPETCIQRIQSRLRKVPAGIVHQFHKEIEKPSFDEGVHTIYTHQGDENKWT